MEYDQINVFFQISCCRLGHGDLIEEEGKSVPFRVEILHMHRLVLLK